MTKALPLLLFPCWIAAADLTGEWNAHLLRFGETFAPARVSFQQEGTKLTGKLNELKLEGTIEGAHLHLTATRPNGKEWGQFQSEVQGTRSPALSKNTMKNLAGTHAASLW